MHANLQAEQFLSYIFTYPAALFDSLFDTYYHEMFHKTS